LLYAKSAGRFFRLIRARGWYATSLVHDCSKCLCAQKHQRGICRYCRLSCHIIWERFHLTDTSGGAEVRQVTFFLFEMSRRSNKTTKVSAARVGGSTAAFCLAFFFFILNLFLISLRFFELVERRQSRPVFPVRMQRLGVGRSVGVSAPSLSPARRAATQSPLHRALRRN